MNSIHNNKIIKKNFSTLPSNTHTTMKYNTNISFLSGAWLRHCSINCTYMSCLLYCIMQLKALFVVSAIINDKVPIAIIINFVTSWLPLYSLLFYSLSPQHLMIETLQTLAPLFMWISALCTLCTNYSWVQFYHIIDRIIINKKYGISNNNNAVPSF